MNHENKSDPAWPGLKNMRGIGILFVAVLALAGCETDGEVLIPNEDAVAEYFSASPTVTASLDGRTVELTVRQQASQLRRGGALWARVGPFIFLFTEETWQLLQDYPDLTGVRVVTRTERGDMVASAYLQNGALTDVLWRRSLNISGKARRDGTRKPTLLEDLVRWGEDRTEFEYNSRYVGR
jgi:hypothetical protein